MDRRRSLITSNILDYLLNAHYNNRRPWIHHNNLQSCVRLQDIPQSLINEQLFKIFNEKPDLVERRRSYKFGVKDIYNYEYRLRRKPTVEEDTLLKNPSIQPAGSKTRRTTPPFTNHESVNEESNPKTASPNDDDEYVCKNKRSISSDDDDEIPQPQTFKKAKSTRRRTTVNLDMEDDDIWFQRLFDEKPKVVVSPDLKLLITLLKKVDHFLHYRSHPIQIKKAYKKFVTIYHP